MKDKLDFYINGEWVSSSSAETIEVVNPATEEVIGSIGAGTKEDINNAVSAAKEAFKTFSKTTAEERSAYIQSIIRFTKEGLMKLLRLLQRKWVLRFGFLK